MPTGKRRPCLRGRKPGSDLVTVSYFHILRIFVQLQVLNIPYLSRACTTEPWYVRQSILQHMHIHKSSGVSTRRVHNEKRIITLIIKTTVKKKMEEMTEQKKEIFSQRILKDR